MGRALRAWLAAAAATVLAAAPAAAAAQGGRPLTGAELRPVLEIQEERPVATAPPQPAPVQVQPGSPAESGEGSEASGAELGVGAPIPTPPPAPSVAGVSVVLRGLDKLTGDLSETSAKVGETARLWRLEIDVKACYARPETGSLDASAFLQIRDTKPDPAETVFSGWMFADSPALSAMDHPRYDVWLLSCTIS